MKRKIEDEESDPADTEMDPPSSPAPLVPNIRILRNKKIKLENNRISCVVPPNPPIPPTSAARPVALPATSDKKGLRERIPLAPLSGGGISGNSGLPGRTSTNTSPVVIRRTNSSLSDKSTASSNVTLGPSENYFSITPENSEIKSRGLKDERNKKPAKKIREIGRNEYLIASEQVLQSQISIFGCDLGYNGYHDVEFDSHGESAEYPYNNIQTGFWFSQFFNQFNCVEEEDSQPFAKDRQCKTHNFF